MRMMVFVLALLSAPSAALCQPAFADTEAAQPMPTTEQGIQERLKSFDPAAVAAARHYFENPAMKRASLSKMKSLLASITAETSGVVGEHKGLDKDAAADVQAESVKIFAAANAATMQNYDLIIGLQTIAALQTFSKDELIAMDNFYSSPTGQQILAKMPDLNNRMPAVMHVVMPKLAAAMKSAMNEDSGGTSDAVHKP